MTKEEAIDYIENYTWSTSRLGLERTIALMAALGDPQKSLHFIHVAGSNGKGSTCAMLESVLRQAGYKTGLYISPYIQDFCERIQVNGDNIPGDDLAKVTEIVKEVADAMDDHPSQFELVTAIALKYFKDIGCDIVVLEVGMGGDLDSTNVIDAPEVAVITNIGLEHTEFLGDTLEKIATTKGGIIKTGCSCVCYDGNPEVTETIRQICADRNVPLRVADFSQIQPREETLHGQSFSYRLNEYFISLIGPHQLCNAAVVLDTIETLKERDYDISDDAVSKGLASTIWPARFEVLSHEPLFILDGGHNPQCATALAESIHTLIPGQKISFILGVLADKDYSTIIDILAPYAAKFYCLTPLSDRALPAENLSSFLIEQGIDAGAFSSISDAICAALESERPVIAFGSLYLAGAVRTEFNKAYKKFLRTKGYSARRSLDPDDVALKSEKICEKIITSEAYELAEQILVYNAIDNEVDLHDLIRHAQEDGKTIVYPLCLKDGTMEARITEVFKPGYKDIPEPDPEHSVLVAPEDLDLVICPLVAFDENGNRIGQGGGYYDRFLPLCKNAKIIAAAFACQRVSKIQTDPWDIQISKIVTEVSE